MQSSWHDEPTPQMHSALAHEPPQDGLFPRHSMWQGGATQAISQEAPGKQLQVSLPQGGMTSLSQDQIEPTASHSAAPSTQLSEPSRCMPEPLSLGRPARNPARTSGALPGARAGAKRLRRCTTPDTAPLTPAAASPRERCAL
jgi:hypothetical protein